MHAYHWKKLNFGGLLVVAHNVDEARKMAIFHLSAREYDHPKDYEYDCRCVRQHEPSDEGPAPLVVETGDEF